MHITKIEPQKRKPGRKNIYIDGQFGVGVSNETVIRFQLRKGDEITPRLLKEMESAEGLAEMKNVALRFLTHRPRTIHEVRQKLLTKKFAEKEIERVLKNLRESGLLDDRQFAGMYIRDQLASQPMGKLLLRQKLRRLGVEKQLADEVLGETFQSISSEETVRRSVEKFLKMRAGTIKDPIVFRRRLAGFLARRGFKIGRAHV